MTEIILTALRHTLYMVFWSTLFSVIIGLDIYQLVVDIYDFPSRSGKSPRKSRVPRDTPFAVAKGWLSTVIEFLMKFDNL